MSVNFSDNLYTLLGGQERLAHAQGQVAGQVQHAIGTAGEHAAKLLKQRMRVQPASGLFGSAAVALKPAGERGLPLTLLVV